MTDELREILSHEEVSDEAAYHLVNLFYHFASSIESIYLGQVLRYEKTMMNPNDRLDNPPEPELDDPPF